MQFRKSIFTAIFGIAALVMGVTAYAQPTLNAADEGTLPLVAPGGTVVFEDQVVTAAAATDLDVGDRVILLLPEGSNFVGTPTATASGTSLSLRSNGAGDPGLKGLVTLSDTNGDGLNDRAEVTVATKSTATDSVTWKGSMTYGGTATSGTLTGSVSVFDDSGSVFALAGSQGDLASAVSSARVGTFVDADGTNAGINIPNATAAAVAPPASSTFILTAPAGTAASSSAGDETVTLTLSGGLTFDATSTIVATALTDGAPALAFTTPVGADAASASVDFASAVTRDSQYLITIGTAFDVKARTTPGAATLTVSGDAGIAGSAVAANLAATGSSVALATGQSVSELVRAADQPLTLPTFEIKEVFATDFAVGTITIAPATGMTFVGSATVTTDDAATDLDSGTAGVQNSVAIAPSGGNITIDIAVAGSTAAETLTVSGITATASTSAAESLELSIGNLGTDIANAPATSLAVATTEARGTVTLTGPTTAATVGQGVSGLTATIALTESTYGAVADAVDNPFIQVSSSDNVTITAVDITTDLGDVGAINLLQIDDGVASVETDGAFNLAVNAESNDAIADADNVDITVTYSVKSTAALGSDVVFTFAGTANVAGSVTVATVSESTVNSVSGVIPDRAVSSDITTTGTLQIKENFATALTDAQSIRLVAPAGVTFQAGGAGTGLTQASIETTNNANDTLLLNLAATGAVDTLTFTPRVIVGPTATAGLNSFTLVDGDQTGASKAGISGGSLDLLYVGELANLSGGADRTVSVGIPQTASVAGGLADYTVASGDEDVFTASVSGSAMTITGVAAGQAVLTVTDALGATDTVTVTVAARPAAPAKTTTTLDGTETTAVVSGGVSVDGGATYSEDGAVAVGSTIDIIVEVTPETEQVGEEASIHIGVIAGDRVYAIAEGLLVDITADVLNGFVDNPDRTITLEATNLINILPGGFTLTEAEEGLTLSVIVAYAIDGVITYNSELIELEVTAAP